MPNSGDRIPHQFLHHLSWNIRVLITVLGRFDIYIRHPIAVCPSNKLVVESSDIIRGYTETKKSDCDSDDGKQILDLVFKNLADSHFQVVFEHDVMFLSLLCFCFYYSVLITSAGLVAAALLT